MAWFKVDDQLWAAPKWLAATPRARALWVSAGSWAMANLTDGYVPAFVLSVLGGTKRDANVLVEVGLWIPVDDGWRFHDWHDYQPTAEQLLAKREASRERVARWRTRKERRQAEDDEAGLDYYDEECNAVTNGITGGNVTALPTPLVTPCVTPLVTPTNPSTPYKRLRSSSLRNVIGEAEANG